MTKAGSTLYGALHDPCFPALGPRRRLLAPAVGHQLPRALIVHHLHPAQLAPGLGEKGMVERLRHRDALRGIGFEHPPDEVAERGGYFCAFREPPDSGRYALIELLETACILERRPPAGKVEGYAARRVDVDLGPVRAAQGDLGCHVRGCADEGAHVGRCSPGVVAGKEGAIEVGQGRRARVVPPPEEHVARLDVAMDDAVGVEVGQAAEDAPQYPADVVLFERPPAPRIVLQVLCGGSSEPTQPCRPAIVLTPPSASSMTR
ncbi:hypothetical protein DFJ74DRAFT_458900 [Hyaloraphidium curvatum]|nr:hypothetical protein DFJ74DRAFT_458900 [Hyaloraphidium curvatum]